MARRIFDQAIDYDTVRIYKGKYLPFQPKTLIALAPNGNIYVRKASYSHDYSKESPDLQNLFIHEMTHVWQHHKGYPVKLRGIQFWKNSYFYKLHRGRRLHDYDMEAQSCILADYYCYRYQGGKGVTESGYDHRRHLDVYENVLHRFFSRDDTVSSLPRV